MMFFRRKLFDEVELFRIKNGLNMNQLILRAVISYIRFDCKHDWKETTNQIYSKYAKDGKEICIVCGIIEAEAVKEQRR